MFRFIFALVVILSGSALAQENQFNCKNPQYQQEMNYCAHQDFFAAEQRYYELYSEAHVSATKMDLDLEARQQGAVQALKEAHQAWVIFRDKACEAEGYSFYGGSMQPLIVWGCKARLTRQRTDGLRLLSEMY